MEIVRSICEKHCFILYDDGGSAREAMRQLDFQVNFRKMTGPGLTDPFLA
jgi:hypothetical protein